MFTALALLLLSPVLIDFGSRAIGDPAADTWNHVWGYWYIERALLGEHPFFDVGLLGYPEGGALWFIDILGALLTAPLGWIAGPVTAYNAALLLNLVFAGLASWRLAFHVTRSLPGAYAAGAIYMLCPHVFGQLHNGISETVATGWLPLSVWLGMRMLEHPSSRRGAAWGFSLICAMTASAYYGVFAGAFAGALLLHALWRTPKRLLAARRALLVGLEVGVVGVLVIAWGFLGSLEDGLVSRDPAFVWKTLIEHNMVDLLSFGHFGPYQSPDLEVLYDEHLMVVVYIGWAALLTGLLGLVRTGSSGGRGWALGAFCCFVLALGPYLYVGGSYLEIADRAVALPFATLADWGLGMDRVAHPYRFAVPLGLCVALLAAFAIAHTRRPTVWAGALVTVHAVELFALSPAEFPLPTSTVDVPGVYEEISTSGAVIDLPASLQVLDRARYNLYQTHHGRPIPYGLNDPTPAVLGNNPLGRLLIDTERTPLRTLEPVLPVIELEVGRRIWVQDGFAAVVLHHDLYPADRDVPVRQLLEMLLGPGERVGNSTWFALDVDPAEAQATSVSGVEQG